MSISKPKSAEPVRPVCPVCGKTAYSRGGIHPQCAASRADRVTRDKAAAREKLHRDKTGEGSDAKSPAKKQWTKRCPRCRRDVAARRFTCDCGHGFQPAGGA